MAFDLLEYLFSRNISFRTEGKNIGPNDIAINCLFCEDPSFHLAIHRSKGMWHCWICGEKGNIFHLVKTIESDGAKIKDVLADYFDYEVREKEEERKQYKIDLNNLEESCYWEGKKNIFFPLILEWIEERGFVRNDLLVWGTLLSKGYNDYFAYRLVVPYIEDEEIVCCVGRDMTGRANIRYLPAPNGSMLLNYQDCIYNIDQTRQRKGGIIFVEGIFDVWRLVVMKELNNYAILGTNGKILSGEQSNIIKNLISNKDLMEVVICLDGGSRKETRQYIKLISLYHRNITVVDLPDNEDPDSLGLKGQFEYYFYRRQRIS